MRILLLRECEKAVILPRRKDVHAMELRHVLGNTWVAEANTALLGIYHVTKKDIVLIDTGFVQTDRAESHRMPREESAVQMQIRSLRETFFVR